MEERQEPSADGPRRDFARQLDESLNQAGYHCLHACAWAKSDRPNLDHVVIGPGGVFLIDDKYMSHEVRTGTDGRVWSGGVGLDAEIDDALGRAEAVASLLGTPVTAVLALHGSQVTAMPVVRGVHLFSASDVAAFLQRRPGHRSPAAVANLAAKANVLLRSERSTRPQVVNHHGRRQ